MNLDERIKEAILSGAESSDWQDRARLLEDISLGFMVGNVKRLIHDVLEYVKPERDVKHEPVYDIEGNELEINWIQRTPDQIIELMEAKAKELGL